MPTLKSKNKVIGITLGDPAGIGAEVAAKALAQVCACPNVHFKIIGDECLFRRFFSAEYPNCSFIDLGSIRSSSFKVGHPSIVTAKASIRYLEKAVELLKENEIDALVTAPVHKEGICRFEPSFRGHTEFLAGAFGREDVGMMFVSPSLKVILVTRHVPLSKVHRMINRELVYKTIELAHAALKDYFHIRKPVIAVCGLNPHAGEGGVMGKEEAASIIPAIRKAQKQKWTVEGPSAADTLFSPEIAHHYDAVVAMYHDQGLIPVKTLCFRQLVNLTVGLPFARTSPAHGTAFNIAGKSKADASSMIEAIKLAVH